MSRRKRVALVGIVVLFVGSLAWYRSRASSAEETGFETASVRRGALVSQVTATGTVSPLVTVLVGSQVSGRISQLFADFNTRVKKNQIIATIDPSLFAADVARAQANVASARAEAASAVAELANAKLQYTRAESLAAKQLVAQADADAALASYKSAEARVDATNANMAQVRAALEQAKTNLAYTHILSPIDGVVISRSVDVGQTVAASLQAPTLFSIAEDLRKMEVHTNVAESDVGRLSQGMSVEFTVDAYPTETFPGVVREVRYSPQTLQNVVTYDAVISVDNSDLRLRPGMTADVIFLVDHKEDVLQVPNAALRFQPPAGVVSDQDVKKLKTDLETKKKTTAQTGSSGGARRVVWIPVGKERLQPAIVEIGITDGRSTEIISGDLKEGQQVVIGTTGAESAGAAGGDQKKPSYGRFL